MGYFSNKKHKTQEELNEEFSKLGDEQGADEGNYPEDDNTDVVEIGAQTKGKQPIKESLPPRMTRESPKPVPKMVARPNSSHSETSKQEIEEELPPSIKKYAEDFNNEFGKIIEPINPLPDKNFTMLFAVYCELKKTNRIMAGQNVLLEDLIKIIKES